METIKFRGISTETGKYVYGDLVRKKGLRKKEIWQIVCKCAYNYVYPYSVVPFVGYDADGNEVYEGDKFTDKFGHTYTARLLPQAICKNGHIRLDWMPKSCDFHIFSDDFNVGEGYCDEEN